MKEFFFVLLFSLLLRFNYQRPFDEFEDMLYIFISVNNLSYNALCVYVGLNKNMRTGLCTRGFCKKNVLIPVSSLPVSLRVKDLALLKDSPGAAAGKELIHIKQSNTEILYTSWNNLVSFLCYVLAYSISFLLSCLFIKYANLGSLSFLFVFLFLWVWLFLFLIVRDLLFFHFVDFIKK